MIFEGTIIITDPCYFAKDEDWNDGFITQEYLINPDLGFTDYIWIYTGFGDTTGVVLSSENEERQLGTFGVDSGSYGVFYLSEVESYNPGKTEYFRKHPGLATIIKNYSGDIRVIKKSIEVCTINCLSGNNFFAAP